MCRGYSENKKKKKTKKKGGLRRLFTVVSSVIIFRTSEYSSRFSTIQSPVKLITERQIDPFTETSIKIAGAWNAIEFQNEVIQKFCSQYATVLILPPFLLLPSFRPPVRPCNWLIVCSSCPSIVSWMRAFARPLAAVHFFSKAVNKAVYHSMTNSMPSKCSAVLALYLLLKVSSHARMFLCFWS